MDCTALRTWILCLLLQLLPQLSETLLSGRKSRSIFDDICERYWEWRLKEFPTFATVQKNYKYDDVLEDYSLEAFVRRKEAADTFRQELDSLNVDELSPGDRMNAAVLMDELDYFRDGHNWRMYGTLTPLNFLEGIQRPPSWVKHMRFDTEEDYETYFSRMKAVEKMIDQAIFLMEKAIELNRTNHEVSMRGVPQQIEQGMLGPANQTMFALPFAPAIMARFNESFKTYLKERGMDIMTKIIQPAYVRLKNFLVNVYSNHTRQHYGVGNFDHGLEYYQACLRFHLSTDISAAEVRKIGLNEVARIKARMEEIMQREGFIGKLSKFMDHLRETRREEFFDRSAEDLLQEFRNIINLRIEPKLDSVIKERPNKTVTIGTTSTDGPLALYFPATGTFEANVREAENRPTFTMMALALHEANPGHHLQITYTNQQSQPEFRRVLWGTKYYAVPYNFPWYTAYTEGWGLYAEYLGEEMGLYNKTALELFGRYSSEIFRACRLVVDTGIHAFGMSRDEAIQYIADHTAMPRSQIEKEVDRYITWPGQACAYKMGEREILRLRHVAEAALGDAFDVKEFNNEVLKAGRVPLHLLEKSIEKWINQVEIAASVSKGALPLAQLWTALSICAARFSLAIIS